ncbi:hypothetical protein GN956_G26706 [Arapaima gigas]
MCCKRRLLNGLADKTQLCLGDKRAYESNHARKEDREDEYDPVEAWRINGEGPPEYRRDTQTHPRTPPLGVQIEELWREFGAVRLQLRR